MPSWSEEFLKTLPVSYRNQEGGILIPRENLGLLVEVPLGFQPWGISSVHLDGGIDEVLVSDYFGPAVCRCLAVKSEAGLKLDVSWVRGADYQGRSIRIFPDISKPSGANRLISANKMTDGRLLLNRTTERQFFVLNPPRPGGTRWRFDSDVIKLADCEPARIVESAFFRLEETLYTVESSDAFVSWSFCEYGLSYGMFTKRDVVSHLPYLLGPGFRSGDDAPWFVTSFLSPLPHGIYRGAGDAARLIIRDVWGTGICFLSDGSALVSRFGQDHPGCFNGIPGALAYVPSSFFEEG